MNFFEQELRKMFAAAKIFDNIQFVGRACYGTLGENTRIKLEFMTNGTHEHYEGIRATALDILGGKLDSVPILFVDLMGKIENTCGHQSGPYAWTYNGKTEWYAYHPTKADYTQITEMVRDYAELFREQTQEQKVQFSMQQQL